MNDMMQEKQIALQDLMLDPNNPRFVRKFDRPQRVPDDAVEGQQNKLLTYFVQKKGQSEYNDSDAEDSLDSVVDEFFDISDLWNSMSNIGLVPIDRIVVRKLINSDKYLVIEGNRRIATAKQLIIKDAQEKNPEKRLSDRIKDTLKIVSVLVLDTTGMSQEEIDHQITIILGLRHHGSVMEWNPLPKAYNIHREYLNLEPKQEAFELDNKRVNAVASRLAVKPSEVRRACATYIVYRQLIDIFDGVKPSHYSLIESAVANGALTGATAYFVRDSSSFQMDEPSLYKMNQLCEFDVRDDSTHDDIVPEPRHFKFLADLVKARNTHENESVRKHAAGLLDQVEAAERTAERAADSLKYFINQKEWSKALSISLDKQEGELDIKDFEPIGAPLTCFKEVLTTFERLRRVLQI